jgi:hypothetical protein
VFAVMSKDLWFEIASMAYRMGRIFVIRDKVDQLWRWLSLALPTSQTAGRHRNYAFAGSVAVFLAVMMKSTGFAVDWTMFWNSGPKIECEKGGWKSCG